MSSYLNFITNHTSNFLNIFTNITNFSSTTLTKGVTFVSENIPPSFQKINCLSQTDKYWLITMVAISAIVLTGGLIGICKSKGLSGKTYSLCSLFLGAISIYNQYSYLNLFKCPQSN